MEKTFHISDRTVTAFLPEQPEGAAWLHAEPDEAAAVWARLPEARFALISVSGCDWNRDFSPWPAPRAFHGGEDFSGGAPAYLRLFAGELLPQTEALLALAPARRALAGYSLAGLFAVWALTQTALFDRAASVSGSMWYDGFADYLDAAQLPRAPERVYFSVGDREKLSRSPRLQLVEQGMARAAARFSALGVPTVCERNPGGHFDDPAGRTARALRCLFG